MDLQYLNNKAKWVKQTAFEMVIKAGKGHMGGSFSLTEALVCLYHGGILKVDPKNPKWELRDRFIISKGHSNNTLYVVLADMGFFPLSELDTYTKNGSLLGGHCDPIIPGIEILTGSLGHGLGVACGMAMAAKLNRQGHRIICAIGDGESQEGSIWEAIMFAAQHKLNNLTVIHDRNFLGSEDWTEDTSGLEPLDEKWRAFNWDVEVVDDGNDIRQLYGALVKVSYDKPRVVISETIKGNGLYSLANTPKAHHTLPRPEDIERTREELAQ